jgi:hypothetical protein
MGLVHLVFGLHCDTKISHPLQLVSSMAHRPNGCLELKLPHFDKYVFVLRSRSYHKFEHEQLFYQLLSVGYGVLFLVSCQFVLPDMFKIVPA